MVYFVNGGAEPADSAARKLISSTDVTYIVVRMGVERTG
jgi:hypothetical protein